MLSELFYWVLNISVIGSMTGFVVLALRRIKKLPSSSVYLFWSVVLIRLWIPLGLASKYSLLSLLSKFTTRTVVIWEKAPMLTMTNSIMGANAYFPIEYKTDLLESFFNVASTVWLIFAAAAILTAFLLYSLTKAELRGAVLLRDNIYKSDKPAAPAVYGILRPKIVIPEDSAESDIPYIIAHEQAHIRRWDNLFRLIAVITVCVHWFNPFIWVFLKYFFSDMELACDAKVLKSLNKEQAREYAAAILSCAAQKTPLVSAFGGARTRTRIENILSYKRLTLLSSLFFAALIIVIAAMLITNAAA